jgi:hypothetical protein
MKEIRRKKFNFKRKRRRRDKKNTESSVGEKGK